MKKITSLLLTVVLLLGLLGSLPVAAAGSLSATASATSVTVGNSVTITLNYSGGGAKIAAIDAQVSYNASAFDYVSCTGATANGGAGVVTLSYYPEGAEAPTAVTIKLTFKAKAAGSGNFAVNTYEFTDDENYASLGAPSKTLSVSATNPTLSGNANLSSLKPSAGTLTPAFSAGTTTYTITVPYTVTSLSLSAATADKNAKVAVSGSNSLKVGKNTQTVTVTAPNGTTKKYTVTITRSADQSSNSSDTTSTTVTPEEDPLEVSVDGELMTVADTQPEITLPDGYSWEPTEVNGVTVSAAKNKDNGLTLLYLTSVTDESASALYIYGEDGQFTLFRPLTVKQSLYTLLPVPEALDVPAGAVAGEITVEDTAVDAFLYEDTALKDIALVYAIGPNGYTGLYVYDQTDGSMQQYRPLTVPAEPEPQEEEKPTNAFVQFVTDYRNVILITAAACGGVALLIGAILLIVVIARRPGNCRH